MAPPLLAPVFVEDVPAMAKMCADSFLTDRQTQLKDLGKERYDMEAMSLQSLPLYILNPKIALIKAVNDKGEIMGYIAWAFRGVELSEIPQIEGAPPKRKPLSDEERKAEDEKEAAEQKIEDEKKRLEEEEKKANGIVEEEDLAKKLNDMESENMNEWMEKLMPEGTKCMFVAGFHVDPAHQRKGAGLALLKWGTDICDKMGLFAWVHSSEGGYAAYKKAGFEEIGKLDVNLDDYARAPPPPEVGGDIWGHYVLTYMKYTGKLA